MSFVQGQSGNPPGRPPGSRNKAALLFEAMVEAEGPKLVETLLTKVKLGHPWAIRLLLARVLPVRRDRPVPIALPPITSPRAACTEIARAAGAGEITPREAIELVRMIEAMLRVLE